ncbi:hypothetical protein AKJ09_01402 [Labilithrix luteola]|uniref:Lipoprotein n=1 Tax=Labilithrix luteola TaxID=1391654 RepID=A0A0K1PMJ0_9BACT|nr:hypothetical protein AKJ09_01402 [Labilithrix luteola]
MGGRLLVGAMVIASVSLVNCSSFDGADGSPATALEQDASTDGPIVEGVPAPAGCDPTVEPKNSPKCVVNDYGVFVDGTTGNDSNAGTKESPVKTIGAARRSCVLGACAQFHRDADAGDRREAVRLTVVNGPASRAAALPTAHASWRESPFACASSCTRGDDEVCAWTHLPWLGAKSTVGNAYGRYATHPRPHRRAAVTSARNRARAFGRWGEA